LRKPGSRTTEKEGGETNYNPGYHVEGKGKQLRPIFEGKGRVKKIGEGEERKKP